MTRSGSDFQFEIDRYDLLGWFLFRKLGLTVVGIVLLQLTYGAFEGLLLPWVEQYSPTVAEYIWFAVLSPTFWAYYALSRTRIPKLFQDIELNDIIEDMASDDFERFVNGIKRNFGLPIWPLLALVASGLVVALVYFVGWQRQPPPFASLPWHRRLSLAVMMVNGYVGALVVLREFVAVYWLRRIFCRFSIRVHPLHPDGAGGFGFIGMHYLGLSLFVVAIGVWLSLFHFILPIIQRRPIVIDSEIIVAWSLYLAGTPMSFFLPLWSAHVAMKQEKAALLQEISSQFDSDFESARSTLHKSAKEIESSLEKVKSLQEMLQLVNETYPTWPYNSRTLRRFSISATLPIVTSLGSLVIDITMK